MTNLVLLPILIPAATAAVAIVVQRRPVVQRWLGVAGAGALLATSIVLLSAVSREGVLALHMGAWPAPFGIVLVADVLAAIMVLLAGLVGFATAIYSLSTINEEHERRGYWILYHVLLMGVCGAFLTGDLFNLYVWFEVLLIASFALLALGGTRDQTEGAFKYVVINLLASMLFLAALGIVFGVAGTLNMAHLAAIIPGQGASAAVAVASVLLLAAFGIKAGVFPLFFWLPASYHTPNIAINAIFAGLLTKVGVYALVRVFSLVFIQDVPFTHGLLLAIAGGTMVVGVLGALAQSQIRRILSFHIISQIGYMVMGLALFTPLALAGCIFYIFHHIIVKTNLFFVAGAVVRLRGTDTLARLGGLSTAKPVLAVIFVISAFSLAGIPPLSGFWAKYILAAAGVATAEFAIVVVALAVGLLTLMSMAKIWHGAFWKEPPGPVSQERPSIAVMLVPMIAFASITVALGLAGQAMFDLTLTAAEQLMDRTAYIDAVRLEVP